MIRKIAGEFMNLKFHYCHWVLLFFVVVSCENERIDPDKYIISPYLSAVRNQNSIILKWSNPLVQFNSKNFMYLPGGTYPETVEIYMSENDTLSFDKIYSAEAQAGEFILDENEKGKDYFFKLKNLADNVLPSFSNIIWIQGGSNPDLNVLVASQNGTFIELGDVSVTDNSIIYTKYSEGIYSNVLRIFARSLTSNQDESIVDGAQASLSPDNQKLAFVSHFGITTTPQPTNLGIYDFEISDWTEITVGDNVVQQPVWSEDGKKIYFLNVDNFYSNPWLLQEMDLQTSVLKTLISPEDMQITNHPISLNSDDGRIYFTAQSPGGTESIYAYHLADEQVSEIELTRWNDYAPSISADGATLAFITNRSGRDEIWLKDLDSQECRQLTGILGSYPQGKIVWNDESTKIYFGGYHNEKVGLHSVNLN